MELIDAIKQRHSVRQYIDKPLEPEMVEKLNALIYEINRDSGLHIQLVTNEPKAFDSFMAHYGNFKGVTSYFAMIGPRGKKLDELCGYYGERLVLEAQRLGLNTCWVASTYKKVPNAFTINRGEKLTDVIALGYGETQGKERKSKSAEEVCDDYASKPDWFKAGVELALLAPTAVNQQKFKFSLNGNKVSVKAGIGPESRVDLGIVKCHFEIGAGKENFEWE